MTVMLTKADLLAGLEDSSQRAHKWFAAIPTQEFFKRDGQIWAASDNLEHLIKAVKPVVLALELPRLSLQALFGKARGVSQSYEEVCASYCAEIAKGAQAPGPFLPELQTPGPHAEVQKEKLLAQWLKTSQKLVACVEKWDEVALDRYQLPHPILGKLTVREMLYFTVHHNLRHASQEGD